MTPRTRRSDTVNGHGSEIVDDVRSQTLERLSGTPVRIDCRDGTTATVHVGKLSIDQLVAIGRLADRARQVLTADQIAEAKEAVSGATEEAQVEAGFNVLLGLLDAETIAALFGILIDRPAQWCRNAPLGAVDMLNIVDAVLEHNSWAEVVAAFQRAARRLRASSAPSST
jgi:hypothetical protein